jgi:hypothetical protein
MRGTTRVKLSFPFFSPNNHPRSRTRKQNKRLIWQSWKFSVGHASFFLWVSGTKFKQVESLKQRDFFAKANDLEGLCLTGQRRFSLSLSSSHFFFCYLSLLKSGKKRRDERKLEWFRTEKEGSGTFGTGSRAIINPQDERLESLLSKKKNCQSARPAREFYWPLEFPFGFHSDILFFSFFLLFPLFFILF